MEKDQVKTIKNLLAKLDRSELAEVQQIVEHLLRQSIRPTTGDAHPDPLEKVIGTCPGPSDLAQEHNKYIYDER